MIRKEIEILLTLAWRNVWKNKRRTILTLLTIMVGCAMIILMNAFAKGGHDRMIEDAVSENSGHIQIHEKGFWDNRGIDYAFKFDAKLRSKLSSMKEIAAFAERIHAGALLSNKEATFGAMVQAVDPEMEPKITAMHRTLVRGKYLDRNDTLSVLIGETMAKNLGVAVGDTVAMISQGFDGSIAAENLTVKGIFRAANPEYDRSLVLMPLAQARETFATMDYVNSVVIRLKRTDLSEPVRDGIRGAVDQKQIEVMAWDQLMPELVQFIVMDDVSAYIFDAILFMVVAFGVLNTIQMSVFERIREFGVMLAIGTRPVQVVWMVLIESFIIACIGVILGSALGWGASYYFQVNPIDYSAYAKEMSVWGINTVIYPADMTAKNGAVTALVTLALAFLFSIAPALRASKLRPIEAIRHL